MKNVEKKLYVYGQLEDKVWGRIVNESHRKIRDMISYPVRNKIRNQVSEVIINEVRHQLLNEFKENLKV
jgi:hypothetical protein